MGWIGPGFRPRSPNAEVARQRHDTSIVLSYEKSAGRWYLVSDAKWATAIRKVLPK